MQKPDPQKTLLGKIIRAFALLFNRASMYNTEHPPTVQALSDFFSNASLGLESVSPLVIIMTRDQFFLEEEPLDPRINASRMAAYFKKAEVQSISFERGLSEAEVKGFLNIFCDARNYPTAEAMKAALPSANVSHIRINHVFFQKMTADEAVVSKDQALGGGGEGAGPLDEETVQMLVTSLLSDDLEKSLSMSQIMGSPGALSQAIVRKDAETRAPGAGASAGGLIQDALAQIGAEVDKALGDGGEAGLPDLAQAVMEMKRKLLEGIEAQKAMGSVYLNEGMIRDEANAITDRVMLKLVRDEYRKGKTSVQRLGQIIRRMVPEAREIQRLLPRIKEALLEEGMPLPDFLELAQSLGKELQSEELSQILHRSAEKIGVEGEELVREFRTNPQQAAELIYLAATLRKGAGDEKVLTDLLVDYVERVGAKMAAEATGAAGEGDRHLEQVMSRVEQALVSQLKKKDINTDIIALVQQKLRGRMDRSVEKIRKDLTESREAGGGLSPEKQSIIGILGEGVQQGEELHRILAEVHRHMQEKGLDENDLVQIRDAVVNEKIGGEKPPIVHITLNPATSRYFIEKEMSRSVRYGTPFSILSFSILKVTPEKAVPQGTLKMLDVYNSATGMLAQLARQSDLIGVLETKKIVAILPMTDQDQARLALRRILKRLQETPIFVREIRVNIMFAASATAFDPDRTPSVDSFLKAAERDIEDMANRLKTVHNIY